jgi:hypothetical protein
MAPRSPHTKTSRLQGLCCLVDTRQFKPAGFATPQISSTCYSVPGAYYHIFKWTPSSSVFSFWESPYCFPYNSDCTNLHPQQQCLRVPVSPHPHHHLLLLLPLDMAILTGMRWNLNVVLICIKWEVEHFMYLLVICISSLENSLFNSHAHFFTEMLVLWGLRFLNSL